MKLSSKEMHQNLVKRLSSTKMDAKLIEKTSHHLATTHKELVDWEEYFPCGIVAPDALCARGRIRVGDLGRLDALLSIKDIVKVEIFPVGIILPEFLVVDAIFAEEGLRDRAGEFQQRFQR